MRLYLVQHGKAVEKSVDPDRPLSDQGEQDVRCIASILAHAGTDPNKIFHSGKTRSRQTAEIFNGALQADAGAIEILGIAPLDSVTEFAGRVSELGEDTMICGHQPFMGRLVSQLLADDEELRLVEYSPGSVACLERSAGGDWALCWFLRPELCHRDD
ncbi:MAG TPA: phosphohistidine phosphatase SixA [Gammaproteobacteria bacterium]|nr:phosphohistidine phosphatase SixA [Gammaproteobacteria bacterium]